jgi:S-adenosylmethionine synthetase
MPLTISLANRLTRRLAAVRKSRELEWLLPDGKSQVTVEYEYGYPKRIEAVVISTHHRPGVSNADIEEGVRSLVIDAVLPAWLVDGQTKVMVNPSGRFEIGGPDADAGLTGRKIIVDTYGGVARHGGGAFSGKDASKVDRSAAYAARHVAKNLVSAGIAERCEIQVSYAIGRAQPTSISVETFGTGALPEQEILHLVRANFDLRPAAIIERLGLRQPIFGPTAAYGHFGRDDIDLPWERTDQAAGLKEAVPATAVTS